MGILLVLAQAPSTARAMCVYNQASIEVSVYFTCGMFCFNDWTTSPNGSYCRPSESGTLKADLTEGLNNVPVYQIQLDVDAHGYVVISQLSSDRINLCAFRADDSLASCQAFNPNTGNVY
jgi:hypothetical protein